MRTRSASHICSKNSFWSSGRSSSVQKGSGMLGYTRGEGVARLYARCLSGSAGGASRHATPRTPWVLLRRPLDGGLAPPHESRVLFPNVASAVLPISEEITARPLFSRTSVARGDVSPVTTARVILV